MSFLSAVAAAGFGLTLWFGCYLASRTPRLSAYRVATLFLLSLAGWFLHNVLCLHVPAVEAVFF